MKKKRKPLKGYTLVRHGQKEGFSARYVRVPREKPFDREHNDLYMSNVTVSYKLEAEQLRNLFGLDPKWHLAGINEDGGYGDQGYRRVTIIFERKVGGPKLAMEILAGEKDQA